MLFMPSCVVKSRSCLGPTQRGAPVSSYSVRRNSSRSASVKKHFLTSVAAAGHVIHSTRELQAKRPRHDCTYYIECCIDLTLNPLRVPHCSKSQRKAPVALAV